MFVEIFMQDLKSNFQNKNKKIKNIENKHENDMWYKKSQEGVLDQDFNGQFLFEKVLRILKDFAGF